MLEVCAKRREACRLLRGGFDFDPISQSFVFDHKIEFEVSLPPIIDLRKTFAEAVSDRRLENPSELFFGWG